MQKDIYLTFDMDWASEDVMSYFYDQICEMDVCGTLHVTNESRVLDSIRKENRLELGIHPNFNGLLQKQKGGVESTNTLENIVVNLKQIVPEAVSVRSHSLVTGSHISKCFYENGIKYESNILYYPNKDMRISFYKDYMGLIHVPFLFEDDLFLLSRESSLLWYFSQENQNPLVFNFHPIHIFLNTENMERYVLCKKYNNDYLKLKRYANTETEGIKDILNSIVKIARDKGYMFKKISEIKL